MLANLTDFVVYGHYVKDQLIILNCGSYENAMTLNGRTPEYYKTMARLSGSPVCQIFMSFRNNREARAMARSLNKSLKPLIPMVAPRNTVRKISKAKIARRIRCIETGIVYDRIKDACAAMGLDVGRMRRHLNAVRFYENLDGWTFVRTFEPPNYSSHNDPFKKIGAP